MKSLKMRCLAFIPSNRDKKFRIYRVSVTKGYLMGLIGRIVGNQKWDKLRGIVTRNLDMFMENTKIWNYLGFFVVFP